MDLANILFSVNRYDKDGDSYEEGIYLHFGEIAVRVAETIEEYEAIVERLKGMTKEIRENL
jgi:hypothetical protein